LTGREPSATQPSSGDGPDAGKFELALRDETGEIEHARFGPDEEVQVVGKAAKGGKALPVPAESGARKTTPKAKGTKSKASKSEGANKAKKGSNAPKPPKEKKPSSICRACDHQERYAGQQCKCCNNEGVFHCLLPPVGG